MKHSLSLFRLLAVAALAAVMVALALPSTASASAPALGGPQDGKVIFGDNYRLQNGDTLDGDLVVLGGNVVLENGSTVNGDVAVMGGNLDASGLIQGNVSLIGGSVKLNDGAVVKGDVSTMGGSLSRDPGATIEGDTVSPNNIPFNFNIPDVPRIQRPIGPGMWFDFEPFARLYGLVTSSIIMALLAMLVAWLWPRPTTRVGNAVLANPAVSGGLGLLTIIVVSGMILVMAITIILLPVSLLAALLLALALIFGWVAIGLEIGNRLESALKADWSPVISAGLGTLAVTALVTVLSWVPCLGWLLAPLVVLAGLGGVLVTRFGTQVYPAAAVVPAPYVPGGPGYGGPTASYPAPQPPYPPANPTDTDYRDPNL